MDDKDTPSPQGLPDVGTPGHPARGPAWKWWVCGLLLLATMLNYMDRLTLNLMAVRILNEFHLDERHYGQLESGFAFAFALGAIVTGWMVDRWNVRWIYPLAVLVWSAAGFATGMVNGFFGLLACRFCLGLAEAGNWPCALRTTQHILAPTERSMGNSILQSGAAFGAVLTPLIVMGLVFAREGGGDPLPGTWRYPFIAIGALGITWMVGWFAVVRGPDLAIAKLAPSPSLMSILGWLVFLLGGDVALRLAREEPERLTQTCAQVFGPETGERIVAIVMGPSTLLIVKTAVCLLGIGGVFVWLWWVTSDDTALPRSVFVRRYWVLAVMVVAINTAWHYFRAWLPLFLQNQHGYSETYTGWFILIYYVATDLGTLTAGFAAMALARHGLSIHRSRLLVFSVCAFLTTLSVVASQLDKGLLLLGLLLVIGFAALGLFPNYYSFSQELTVRHQGKLTGALGCTNWLAMYLLHEAVGESIKRTGSYRDGVAYAGLVPLVGLFAILFFWGKPAKE